VARKVRAERTRREWQAMRAENAREPEEALKIGKRCGMAEPRRVRRCEGAARCPRRERGEARARQEVQV